MIKSAIHSLLIAMVIFPMTSVSHAADTINFIHLNDLHAHLTPHADLQRTHGPLGEDTITVQRGGLARISTLVKEIRSSDNGNNKRTVVMNVGDTYHGGVEAFYTVGNAIAPAINALGIDIGVPGNWDFTYGPSIFWLRYTDMTREELATFGFPIPAGPILRPAYPNLAANVTFTLPGRAGDTILPPTRMETYGKTTVGFIGLTSDIVPRQSSFLATGMDFLEGESNYKALVDALAADLRSDGADLVVVMSELGLHKSVQLGNVLAEGGVDYIFAAHTHELVTEPIVTDSGASVVEAGNDSYVGVMTVRIANGKIKRSNWNVIPVTPLIPEDPVVAGIVNSVRAPFLRDDVFMQAPTFPAQFLTQPIDRVIGSASSPLNRREALESSFNNAYNDFARNLTGTDIAFSPGFRYDAIIGDELDYVTAGEITVEDIYRYFPQSFALATGITSGQRIYQLVEQGLATTFSTDAFRHVGGYAWGLSGLDATVDLASPDGMRLRGLRSTDTGPINPGAQYSVTGCLAPVEVSSPTDRLCNQPGFANVQPVIRDPMRGIPWTPIDLMIAMLQSGQQPDGERRSISDLNDTLFWPDTPYIQPLGGVQ